MKMVHVVLALSVLLVVLYLTLPSPFSVAETPSLNYTPNGYTPGEGVWVMDELTGRVVQRWNHEYFHLPKCPPLSQTIERNKVQTHAKTVTFTGKVTPTSERARSPMHFEVADSDGSKRFVMKKGWFRVEDYETVGKVVVMSIFDHPQGPNRNFDRFLKVITSLNYPKSKIAISLITCSENDYADLKSIFLTNFSKFGFISVHLFLVTEELSKTIPKRPDWPEEIYERERRRRLAKLRNYLILTGLKDEIAVLWINSEVLQMPSNLLPTFMDSGLDIITTRVHKCINGLCDEVKDHTWIGPRREPTSQELDQMYRGGVFAGGPSRLISADGRSRGPTKYLDDFIDEGRKFIEVDSVGADVLFVRADVHRDGVIFPPVMTVGTIWEVEGYDGIESDGICLFAKRLCYRCWGMPNQVVSFGS
eukprot:TRINITY_DN3138_c0_g1_i1.p1 TRINITY_DN3138_c0_g1~~TRINITY_DN3138_c0_g1_i1.p1  ORF type:complete len:420 (+),score=92.60 TRINITY_DN3138_c0_g1_i1:689-1948(+)